MMPRLVGRFSNPAERVRGSRSNVGDEGSVRPNQFLRHRGLDRFDSG